MITQERLQELFDYKDGVLSWRIKPARRILVGQVAGHIRSDGYATTTVDSKKYLNHRLIFLMHNGYSPECIDHIDGNPLNNRIENLRDATFSQNLQNSKTYTTNKSGVKGVNWNKQHNKWQALIQTGGKAKHIGYFKELDAATDAVKSARLNLHKEYANHG